MLAKLLIDFGLVILIWMTQLVVYPSFTHFGQDELFSWHQKYTKAISVIVMPLMLGQVVSHGYFLYTDFDIINLIATVLIAIAWVNTFSLPCHYTIKSALARKSSSLLKDLYESTGYGLFFGRECSC